MGRASKIQAWAKPEALGLTHPYRWVEPTKPNLSQPF